MSTKTTWISLSFLLPVCVEALVKFSVEHISPSDSQNAMVSIAAAFWLLWIPLSDRDPARVGNPLRIPMILLGGAFFGTCVLYFLPFIGKKLSVGYDPITELLSSLLYVGAGFALLTKEPSMEYRHCDLASLLVLTMLLVLAALTKFFFDNPLHPSPDSAASRLVINVCNGGILLTVYGQVRRNRTGLSPVIHVSILAFAIAQIVAQGRCVPTAGCGIESVEGVVALGISWTLLLGKVAFSLFLVESYNHHRPTPQLAAARA